MNEITTIERKKGVSTGVRRPGVVAWLHLMRVYHKMQHHSGDHLDAYSLTPAQFEVIARLSAEQGITQQALAERLMVTKGNVCGLIDRLSAQGLVERCADPEDRRNNLLYLTVAGRELADKVIPAHEEFILEHMSALPQEDLRGLQRLLGTLDRYLERHH
jgi:DNA-binding MarR family transcriptional regulator